jgi:hypothetical protein
MIFSMNVLLPDWLDQVEGVDFTPEKEILSDLEQWASADGWEVSDGSALPSEFRKRTDVLLDEPNKKRQLRIAVLPKAKRGPGMIRIDASSHRIFELVYQPRKQRWRVETAAVPLSDDLREQGWTWLTQLAFRA